MKYLKRFNESGSHDWRANFFPGATEEEIEEILAKYKQTEIDKLVKSAEEEKPEANSETKNSIFTDEQYEMLMMGYPMSQVIAYGEKNGK